MRFGWEHPATLAALALLAPLAWLWLRRRRRPPATVSSLVLWRRIARPQGPRRERRLPPLFVAQALLLAAGAHEVIDSVADLPDAIARIEQRMASGETP